MAELCCPSAKVIRCATNCGYARGNNTGARQLLADGCRYLAFVNPDVTVEAGTLSQMMAVLSERGDAGCVGGVAVAEGRAFEGAFRTKPAIAEKLWIYSSIRNFPFVRQWLKGMTQALESRHFLKLATPQSVYAVSGACIMFPAEAFARAGGFDENTFLYQEEFIMSERLKGAGYKVYGSPEAIYEHHLGHSAHVNFVRSKTFFNQSEQYYLRTYYKCGIPIRVLVKVFRWADLKVWTTLMFLKRLLRRTSSDCRSESVS
jgi:GT2 family glycosyltransferase